MGCIPVATLLVAVSLLAAGWLWRQTGVALISVHEVAVSEIVPLGILVLIRSVCAGLALLTLLCVYSNTTGFTFHYQQATVLLRRHTRFTTFTVWCFVLLCGYFILAATCSGAVLAGYAALVPPWLVTGTLILFEMSYPMSLLVSAVVTFVLIPVARRHQHPIGRLFRWRPLMMHSGNVLMMQLAMLSAPPPVTLAHLPYAVLFGCSYALFACYWFWRTGVFYYFFLDYRRPAALWTYLGLLATVALLYSLSYGIAHLARQQDSRWWTYPCLSLCTLSLVRVREPAPGPAPPPAPSLA